MEIRWNEEMHRQPAHFDCPSLAPPNPYHGHPEIISDPPPAPSTIYNTVYTINAETKLHIFTHVGVESRQAKSTDLLGLLVRILIQILWGWRKIAIITILYF